MLVTEIRRKKGPSSVNRWTGWLGVAGHAETRRVEIGGFRTLAGAWAGFRDWAIRSNVRLTVY